MIKKLALYAIAFLLVSCSANKYLNENQKYFEGHENKYVDDKSKLPDQLKYELENDLKPDATRRFFISRPGTWIFQSMGELEKKKGIKHFIKYKLGTQPKYLSDLNLDRNSNIIKSKLRANGFFRAEVQPTLDSNDTRATAVYRITLNEPYYFDSLKICDAPEIACNKIRASHDTLPAIKQGELFRKSSLTKERDNIGKYFKNDGYYYFSSEYTSFKADSNDGSHKVKLKLKLNPQTPPQALEPYRIRNISVNMASSSNNTTTIGDSIKIKIDSTQLYIKPHKLRPFIAMRQGQLFNKTDEELTIKQFNRLNVFEFVNITYEPDTLNGNRFLDATILATPRMKQSLSSEVVLSTTSTNFTGPGIQLEYLNRNIFRGAENFRFTANARYGAQLSGSRRGLSTYEIDIAAALLIPRVTGPLKNVGETDGNVPKTKYELRYRLYNQPNYYAQSSFGASYGWEWLVGNSLFNDFRLINIDYVQLLESSSRLEDLFESGILPRQSFNDQFIVGPQYNLTYSPPPERNQIFRFFFSGSAESAGNILYGAYSLGETEKNNGGQYELFNVPFSQYARFTTDFREYIQLSDNNKLVLRQNFGLGFPYLNSSVLPFAKQFFVGGASSLRAFQPRGVGPGIYKNPDPNDRNSFFDATGDILIEFNAENRFDMGGYLEGAVFVDAGNVWLQNESSNRPGGEFKFDSFLKQTAVATGVGLRIDLEFLVVRFDLAFPLRIPSRPEGDRWVFDEISIDKEWRQDNLLLNFAIGYPF